MNKTYKVIYNRTRCMYQVVSELAKGHTKSETPEMLKSLFSKHSGLTRGIVMAVLSMSLAMPVGVAVQAADTADTGETTTSSRDTTKADVDAGNIGKNLKNADGSVAATVEEITANEKAWGTAIGTGNIAAPSGMLVTDTAVHDELRPTDGTYVKSSQTTAQNLTKLDTRVGMNTGDITNLKNLSNLTEAGQKAIQTASQNAVKVAAGTNIKVDSSTANDGSKTYTVSAKTDGKVAQGDTGLVSGDTVNTAITNAVSNASTDINIKLFRKADVDAGNIGKNLKNADGAAAVTAEEITANEKAWGTAIGMGNISTPAGMLVTDTSVNAELRPDDGTYVKKANTTASNLSALDTNLKNVITAVGLDVDDTTKSYTSKLNKYFKVNPTSTTVADAAANGTNSVAIGPSAQAGEKTTDATTSTTTITGGTSSAAIGDSAVANGDKSVALGYNSQVLNASGLTAAVSGSTAIGNEAKVEGGSDSTALGTGATVDTASNAMALGTSATINKTATSGVAIGNGAVTGLADTTKVVDNVTYNVKAAGGEDSVAIGTSASSAGDTSIALGKGAAIENDTDGNYQAVVKSDDIAIGTGAKTSVSDSSTAIGKSATVSQSTDAMAIGSSASVGASSNDAMALGKGAAVGSGAADSIAMGTSAKTVSADTIAIGQDTSATGANSVVIGKGATTTVEGGNAIGSSSTASGYSTAIGQSAKANNYNAVAIGNNATANADRSISLGYNAGVGTSEGKGETQNAGSLIAIGTSSGNNVSGMQNVAIGEGAGSNVKSSYNVAIGSQAGYGINYASDNKSQNGFNVSIGYKANYQENFADIMYATALGNEANASNYSVAIGNRAKAGGAHTVAVGEDAQASDASSIALGQNASAADGNIAIGNGSSAPAVSTLGTVKAVTVDNKTVNYVYDANGNQFKSAFTYKPLQADSHYISVGNSTLTRRISNVADGVFESDAATVGQLNSLNELLQATDTKVGLNKEYFEEKFTNLNTMLDSKKTKYFSVSTSSDDLTANADNTGAVTGKADAMAIGPNANATNVKSLAVGNNVYANGLRSIAIGTAPNPTKDSAGTTTTHNTSADGENSIALGTSTTAQAANSIAIGTRAQTYTTDTTGNTSVSSVAIGNLATTAGNQSVALGYNATVKYNYGTAIGAEALASGNDAVAIGKGSKAYSTDSTAIGQDNSITGNNVYGLGSSNEMNGKWGAITQSGVSGYKNIITSVSDQDTTNALTGIYMTGNSNTLNQNVEYNVMQDITVQGSSNTIDGGAGGTSSHQNTLSQIAIVGSGNAIVGSGNTVQGKSSDDGKTNNIKDVTILGYNNKVDANTDTTVDFSNTQILGNNVTATLGNSVYLGNNAAYVQPNGPAQDAIDSAKTKADTAAEASDEYKAATTDEDKATIKAQYEAKYLYKLRVQAMEAKGTTAGMNSYNTDETYGNGTNYTYAGSNPTGVITVGSVGSERRIQNVAAGLVSATSTDAVNGSQLYALTRQIRFGGDNSSFGKTTAAEDQNVVARGSNETISITGGSDAVKSSTADGTTTYTVDAAKLTGNNIAVVADKDANALHVQLASNLKDLNTAQLGSGSGDSYKETIKLDGTDTTNGGTLELKDATGANGVTLRTSGTTTTADVNGKATTRLLVNDKTVATTDDGLKFGGDTGNDSALKLNNKLNVKGGTTDTSKLTDSNIGVVSDGSGTLTVKLNKNVNLGTDGSLTTGAVTATAVTADTVTSGNSTLNTNGLTITNGPSVLATGINADSKKITNVSEGEANADAANYGQVKAAKTTLSQGNNVTITPNTASEDGHTNYTVSVSNLYYKAGTDTTAKDVALATGLTFNNGKNTTAVAGDNGTITYNLNDKIELGSETDSNNHIVVDGTKGLLTLGMDATINGNAGTASIGGVSIGKSGTDQVITGLTNKTWNVGTTQAVDGRAATENQLQSVADNLNTANTNIATLQRGFKVQVNGDTTTESTVKADDALNFTAGNNAKVTTTKDSKQITISVDNLSVKATNGTAQSVKLADGLNFQDGTNTMAVVGANGSVTYDLKSSITLGTATDEANRIIVNGTNGTITVGNLATINGNAGTASIGGVSIGKSGSDQTVTGLSNKTWVVGKSTAVNGRAATEDQLQSVSNAAYTNANNITTLQQGFTVTANNDNDKKSTIKAGDKLNFQAGKNVQVSTTADSKSIEVALSDTPEFTTVTAKDANGNITTVSGTGVTIAPTGTGTQSVSLTSEGLDNGNHVIKNVASGGDTDTNAANISDVKRLVEASANGTTETGFNVKGDDATTAKKVKLGKQLNVVGGTTDSTQLSAGNIGVVTTADAEGNATLTVKLKKDIALDSVTTGSTTMNTTGISNGDMSLTNTGLIIKNNDVSKQVSITTSGVSMGSQQVKNVADGTDTKDAVNKGQLDVVQTQVTNGWQIVGSNGQKVADIGAGKKVTFGDTTYATASVQPDGTEGATVTYTINTAGLTADTETGKITEPTTDGVATAQNVAQAINNAAWNIKANDGTATAIKAGTTVGLKAGNNLTLSQNGTDFTYKLNDTLTGIQSLTTAAQNGYTTEFTANGVTITPSDNTKSPISLTTNGLDNGNHVIKNVASGGTERTNAANIGDLQDAISNASTTTTNIGFKVKGDDTTSQTVKLGKQLNVVGGTTDSTQLSTGNIGVETTADAEGNATLTVKLKKDIALDSVTTGSSTLDTNGLTITGGPSVLKSGINAGNQKITGVLAGTETTDAVNKGQLDALANTVNGGWTIQAGKATGNAQIVKPGDKVTLDAGNNLQLTQNGTAFTYSLAEDLTGLQSVTAGDAKNNQAVLTGEGLKVTDKDGNSLTQHTTEIRLHSSNTDTADTSKDVVLDNSGLIVGNNIKFTNSGISAGDQKITGVADGELREGSKEAVNGGQLYALKQQVGSGWKLTGDDTTQATNIGAGAQVSVKSGNFAKVTVNKSDSGATIQYDVQTQKITTNGGKAKTAKDGVATTQDVVNAINDSYWTLTSGQTGTGKATGTAVSNVTAGTAVTLQAGDNLLLNQAGNSFTYALNPVVAGMTSISFTGMGTGSDGKTVNDLVIGLQNGGGANPNKGYYITGLSNTEWNQSNYQGDRAATEAQLREAIDKVSAATGTGGFGLTADEGANNGGEKKVSQTLGRTIAIQGDGTYDAESKVVKQGNITTVAYTDNAGPTGAIKVKLNKDIDLSETGSLTIGASKVSAGSIVLDNTGDVAKKIALNSTTGTAAIGGVTVNGAEKTVNGLSNTKWTGKAVDGQAATENQLVEAINEAKTQAANSELHIKKGVYAIGKDSQGQDITDTKGKNSVSIDVVNANGTVDGQVVINDVAKASELGTVGELADNLKNPAGGSTTVVQAVNKVNQRIDESLTKVNGDISNAVTEARKHTEVKSVDSDNNVTIDGTTTNADGGTIYKLGLNKNYLNLGNVHVYGNEGRITANTVEAETVKIDDQTRLDETGLTTGNTTVANNRIVVGDNGIKIEANGGQQTISGLTNTDWTGTAVHGRAATEDQLAKAISSATTTAAQNEQHIKAGTYDIQTTTDDKGNRQNSVTMKIVDGTGKDKGTVTINDVAKASDVGDTDKLAADIKNQNGGQPQTTSVVEAVNNLNEKVNNRVGDNKYSAITSTDPVQDGDSSTTAIGKLNNRMNNIYNTTTQHTTISNPDNNLDIKDTTGKKDYTINLKHQISLGDVKIDGDKGSIEAKSVKADTFTSGSTVVSNSGVAVGGKTYVSSDGLNANSQKITNVQAGVADTDAVNKKQLDDAKSEVTSGYQAADAKLDDEIRQTNAGLNEVGRAVNKLGNRLNRVGAGTAALAALHPGTYDPNDKWDFSAGIGHYHDANAVAIGAYYHPNDTTILSIGGSMGGGENMVNAGITWKMGRSGREQAAQPVVVRKEEAAPVVQQAAPVRTAPVVTPAPVTTPAPVKSVASVTPVQAVPAVTTPMTQVTTGDTAALAQILARQTAILEKLAQNQSQAAPSAAVAHGDDIFPDVPDNHWAYAYVAKLEKAGALKGFKRPAVLKSPMMTRDDFASVLYTAMANGATTNPALNGDDSLNRLAQEFKAELKNVKA